MSQPAHTLFRTSHGPRMLATCGVVALACIAGSSVGAPGAPGSTPPDVALRAAGRAARPDAAARLERYPTDLDFLIAVDGLADQRATPAGRAAERFLGVIGAFDRTGEAWHELSNAMGMDSRGAVDALLGMQVAVALRTDDSGTPQIAVRSTVRRDVRDRVSAAFKPSPRGLVRGVAVLSLGNGSIEMASCPSPTRDRDGQECAELILAPRGSGGLFDSMLRSLREPPPDHALDLAWASLRSLGPSPIAMLLRGKRGDDASQEFFALAARPSDEGWTADFVATRSMLDAGSGLLPADLTGAFQADDGPTPRGVIRPDALERRMRDGAILYMSGPVHPSTAEDAPEARMRMPLTAAMSRFGFTPAIWSRVGGVAFVSVHAQQDAENSTEGASSNIVMSLAFPVADISGFAPLADSWGLCFAKGQGEIDAEPAPSDDAPSIPLDAVRAMEVHGSSQISGLVGPRGAIAWTFARAAGQDAANEGAPTRGWWIVCAQTGDVRARSVVERAQALARDAASAGDASGDVVFRFMSRPAMMRQVTGARGVTQTSEARGDTLGAALANRVRDGASGALDTLDRVETVIRRRPTFNELFDGTISIQMRPAP